MGLWLQTDMWHIQILGVTVLFIYLFFCNDEDALQHLWLCYPRLSPLASVLQQLHRGLGEVLEDRLVFGPR